MAKVSVIIPVYNTGEYLRKCVDSVLGQTAQDLELILIDDGSKEDTARICDELARQDRRIRLLHKTNEGVSVARNAGLSMVGGEYVGFVDSDDWVDPEMFDTLANEMERHGADLALCDATTVWDDGRKEADTFSCLPESCTLAREAVTPARLLELAGSSWRVLYKARLLKEQGAAFPAGLKFSEDRIFNMAALGCCKSMRYVKQSFYNRYMRAGSCVNTFHPDFVDVTLRVNSVMNDVLRKYWDESYIPAFEERNLRAIGAHAVAIFLADALPFKERVSAVKHLCRNPEVQALLSRQPSLGFRLRQVARCNIAALFLLAQAVRIKNAARAVR